MTLRPRILTTIWRKELSETLRDRRTLFVMIVLPVLLYPMLFMGVSRLAESESEATLARPSVVALWGTPPPALERELGARDRLAVRPWLAVPESIRRSLAAGMTPPATRPASAPDRRRDPDEAPPIEEAPNPVLAAARELVSSRRVDAVLVIWNQHDASIYFDSVRRDSEVAGARLRRALIAYVGRVAPSPLDIASRDVSPPSRQAGRVIGAMLPFLLLTLCIAGGLYPAIDLTAGEKERGTMQTLMCAPVLPIEIIGGKFLAVWTLTLASALANVISLALTVTRTLPVDGGAVPMSAYVLTAAILVPITFLTSALFLALAVFARDYKEAQGFLTPVYMALALPAVVTMVPTIELNAWTTFAPIVNIALLIKALLVGEASAELAFLTILSSLLYASLGLALAVRVFQREQVLLGGRESMRDLFAIRGGIRVPTPGLALVMFSIAIVSAFYGTLLLESQPFMTALLVMQFGFFLLPVVAATVLLRMDARETFALRRPPVGPLLACAVLGLTAWTFASGVLLRLAPPPDSLVEALERILMLRDVPTPLWVIWLVVAVTPAVCEEMLFRGFILRGLRPLGPTAAIVISALLFGVAHASIYRLLPTFFLGLVLGFVVWRTGSLLCAMVLHAFNNGVLATLTESAALARSLGIDQATDALPWPVTAGGTVIAAAALALLVAMSGDGMGVRRNRTAPAGASPQPDGVTS